MATKKNITMLDDELDAPAAAPAPAAKKTAGRASPDSGRAKRGRPAQGENGAPVRESRVGMTLYYPPEVRKGLKQLAMDEDTTIQALVGEAIDMLLRDRKKHPFGAR
jgi:hypothetical protein